MSFTKGTKGRFILDRTSECEVLIPNKAALGVPRLPHDAPPFTRSARAWAAGYNRVF